MSVVRNRKNYLGQTFGNMLVKECLGSKNNCIMWLCECKICGYQKIVTSGNVPRQTGCRNCRKPEEKIGKKYQMLTVLEKAGKNKYNAQLYKCQCDCGNIIIIPSHSINRTMSCGCIRKRKILEPGYRINMRTVIEQLDNDMVRMRCDCGNEKIVSYSNFIDKRTISCGCILGESQKKDITGMRFGKLVAIEETRTDAKKYANSYGSIIYWKFKCDCGKIVEINKNNVTSGKQISCGCYRYDMVQKTIGKRTSFDSTNIHIIKPNQRKPGRTGVVGVNPTLTPGVYNARIYFQKKMYNLGNHDLEKAIAIRKEAESRIFDNFIKWYEKNKLLIKQGKIIHYDKK